MKPDKENLAYASVVTSEKVDLVRFKMARGSSCLCLCLTYAGSRDTHKHKEKKISFSCPCAYASVYGYFTPVPTRFFLCLCLSQKWKPATYIGIQTIDVTMCPLYKLCFKKKEQGRSSFPYLKNNTYPNTYLIVGNKEQMLRL